MSGQVSRGSAGEYQADEWAGVAWLSWRVGLVLGVNGVAGMLASSTVSGFVLACMMSNAGGAWDNAKKYIEAGNHGGKGSEPHKAAVVGDTVGDPFKDTSGPSINILIKLLSVVAIVFVPVVLSFSLIK